MKTKVCNACRKYNKINAAQKFLKIINNHSKTSNIRELQQFKGRRVVIMANFEGIDKCLNMLNNDQFKKLNDDPTKTIESKNPA